MAKKTTHTLVKSICIVCGAPVYARTEVKFCVKKSTCRVKYHQLQLKQRAIEKSLMTNMDDYLMYVKFIEVFPDLKGAVENFIAMFGVAQTLTCIEMCYAVAAITQERVKHDLFPTE